MNNIDRYFTLMEQRPELFDNTDSSYVIIKDPAEIEAFEQAHNRKLGVVYESSFNTLVVDLVEGVNGNRFAYERVIPSKVGTPVMMIPVNEKGEMILLKQYRHAPRKIQYSFPRGFGEDGITSRDNACKELKEELGAVTTSLEYLGKVLPDSGLTSTTVDVYLAHVSNEGAYAEDEGIKGLLVVNKEQILNMIRNNEIDDSFTLAGICFLMTKGFL